MDIPNHQQAGAYRISLSLLHCYAFKPQSPVFIHAMVFEIKDIPTIGPAFTEF
jgi:hypothetical protein